MSKLARALVLAAILAAMSLAGPSAVAQAQVPVQATSHDAMRPPTDRQFTSSERAAAHAAHLRLLLAEQRSSSTWGDQDPASQRLREQERYYSTWRYGDTGASAPATPSRRAASGWRIPALGVLAAVLVLIAGGVGQAARRATRPQRAGQTT